MSTGKFCFAKEIEPASMPFGSLRGIVGPSSAAARQLVIVEGVMKPGLGHDFHRHPHQEEVIYIIEGNLEQWIEDQKHVLGPGDSVFIPAGVVHASFAAGKGDAKLLAIFGPSVGDGIETIEMADTRPWKSLRASS